ncbi:hypothetical protein PFICI_06718 [Pestalotiopsis fici W106-1]|uniref:Uncharacterized protein n=1 Tax=Pestalotiopsis fici (strain W106-1 / CGMCC3.15140) TaxID=1229662 RepID=W3X982_PESFW|nr:uncharacterized protein PFICI_06718 [Pestalotiopsis fici W106-1]ETS81716.1 hypothetical protein PFICI_06718 [Pestalotiopsis fici W106-1]
MPLIRPIPLAPIETEQLPEVEIKEVCNAESSEAGLVQLLYQQHHLEMIMRMKEHENLLGEMAWLYPHLKDVTYDAQPFRLKSGGLWTKPGMINIIEPIRHPDRPAPEIYWHFGETVFKPFFHKRFARTIYRLGWEPNQMYLIHDDITLRIVQGEADFNWLRPRIPTQP